MKRVAIVVQRCHQSVVGGSESLAWNYASLLRDSYEVDVLTTTATEISDWANVLPEGREQRDGINIIRFSVTVGRDAYWGQLYDRLRGGFNPFTPGRHRNSEQDLQLNWTLALQEDFIKHQGPYSEPLLKFIREHWRDYQAIIFVTYLYPTSYFGLHELPPRNALFTPTLHDEQPAYLPAFKHAAHRAREVLWLTEAEARVGQKLWGDLPGRVVGMSVDTKLREPEQSPIPYLLYSGRVDPNKGCAELFEFYFKYKRATRSRLRLVITGAADMPIPPHPDIDFRGFVPAEEKFRLMAGAAVFVIPSPNESFSIVTLEAMAQRTPVLANAASEVMVDHIKRSGAGALYRNYETFASALDSLLRKPANGQPRETAGRDYVTTNYETDQIKSKLIKAIEPVDAVPESFRFLRKPANGQPRETAGRDYVTVPESFRFTREQFQERFERNLRDCRWREHPRYSPFTQYDQEYYLARRAAFVQKYRCFYAVSRTIRPRSIIELGTLAGAGGDAYQSASPDASFVGIDVFGKSLRHDDNSEWDPYEVARALFTDRGFRDWKLLRADLRKVGRLKSHADMVVVDAAHDFDNEYEDLRLALTADPTFIFVDDVDDELGAKPAIEKFLRDDVNGRVEYTVPIDYVGGGLVIKLRGDSLTEQTADDIQPNSQTQQ